MSKLLTCPGTWPVLALTALVTVGCAGGATRVPFQVGGQDNQTVALEQIRARLAGAGNDGGAGHAVSISAAPHTLEAHDLGSGKTLWATPVTPSSRPLIAGRLVALHQTGEVVVRRLSDGATVHRIPDRGMFLAGAAGQGEVSAIVLSSGGSHRARSRLVILRGDAVVQDSQPVAALGLPAVADRMIFVPWNNQYLSVLSAQGKEIARIRIKGDVIGEAVVRDGALFFGNRGLSVLSGGAPLPTTDSAEPWVPGLGRLPGNPPFLRRATKRPPPFDSSANGVGLVWRPTLLQGRPALTDDQATAVFYRHLIALRPSSGAPIWAYTHASDLVGAHAVKGGIWIADRRGTVSFVANGGQASPRLTMKSKPVAVSFATDAAPAAISKAPEVDVVTQLSGLASTRDTRLLPSARLAARLLTVVPDARATGALIDLCHNSALPPQVRAQGCEGIAERRNGSQAIQAALERSANFLKDHAPPPVTSLSRAAAGMELRAALPALLNLLQDPATADLHLPALLASLAKLGDTGTAPPVDAFVRRYHAEGGGAELIAALVQATNVVAALDPDRGASLRAMLESDPMTDGRLVEALAKRASADAGPVPDGTAASAPEAQYDSEGDTLPRRLTPQHIESTLDAVMQDLRACLNADPGHSVTARITMLVSADGGVKLVQTLPKRLGPCMVPLLEGAQFPETLSVRDQTLTVTVNR